MPGTNNQTKESKLDNLKSILESYKSVIVAYSGGVDSTFLCYVANTVLKDKFQAVTAVSETMPEKELSICKEIAKQYGWNHHIIYSNELNNKDFTDNPPDKCAICKEIKFTEILNSIHMYNSTKLLSGDNYDDLNDYRPGLKKAQELGVQTPLIETKITKNDIREFLKEWNIPNYDKPATPCIASRIPYGTEITKKSLKMITSAEAFIKKLGYDIVRVRHHGSLARIEIEQGKILNFISFHSGIVDKHLKELGYTYTTLDLSGYQMGSLNKEINTENGS